VLAEFLVSFPSPPLCSLEPKTLVNAVFYFEEQVRRILVRKGWQFFLFFSAV